MFTFRLIHFASVYNLLDSFFFLFVSFRCMMIFSERTFVYVCNVCISLNIYEELEKMKDSDFGIRRSFQTKMVRCVDVHVN